MITGKAAKRRVLGGNQDIPTAQRLIVRLVVEERGVSVVCPIRSGRLKAGSSDVPFPQLMRPASVKAAPGCSRDGVAERHQPLIVVWLDEPSSRVFLEWDAALGPRPNPRPC